MYAYLIYRKTNCGVCFAHITSIKEKEEEEEFSALKQKKKRD